MKKLIFLFVTSLSISSNASAGIDKSFLTVGISSNDYSFNSTTSSTIGSGTAANIPSNLNAQGGTFSSSKESLSISINKNLSLNNTKLFNVQLDSDQFKKTFLNYELFYDHLANSTSTNGFTSINGNSVTLPTNVNFKSRFGFKIGLGYAFNDIFSIYTNIGLSSLDYEIDNRSNSQALNAGTTYGGSTNDRTLDKVFSVGFNYNIYNYLRLGLEYSIQSFDLRSSDFITAGPSGINKTSFEGDIETFMFRISKEL